jgi:hypothetical protein
MPFALGLVGAVVLLLAVNARRLAAVDVIAVVVTSAVVAGLFFPGQFYDHYAYFSAAFLALVAGACTGLVARAVVDAWHREKARPSLAAAVALASVVGCVGAVQLASRSMRDARSYFADAADPGDAIRTALPAGACAVSDDPVLLLIADRFVAGPPCPAVVDPFGMWLTEAEGSLPHLGGPWPAGFVARWSGWLQEVDYVVLSIPGSSYIPFAPTLAEQFDVDFVRVGARNHAYVFARIR